MRLQLTALALVASAIAVPPATASAQSRVSARVDVYSDSLITVVSPATAVSVAVSEAASVEAGYTIDILSGATYVYTADAITSATTFSEQRHEAYMAATVALSPTVRLTPGFTVSEEPDYSTTAFSLGIEFELFDRMSTLGLSYATSFEGVGMSTDPSFHQNIVGYTLGMSWKQILGPHTTLAFVSTATISDCEAGLGCQANPYRFVPVWDSGNNSRVAFALTERHPDLRVRGAGAVQVSQDLGAGVALHVRYRLYGDSWEVLGHTVRTSIAAGFWDEQLVLRADGRFAYQGGASFYRDSYRASAGGSDGPAYRTADRELATLYDGTAELRVEGTMLAVGPFMRLVAHIRAGHTWYHYVDYSELPERAAWLVGGGLHAEF